MPILEEHIQNIEKNEPAIVKLEPSKNLSELTEQIFLNIDWVIDTVGPTRSEIVKKLNKLKKFLAEENLQAACGLLNAQSERSLLNDFKNNESDAEIVAVLKFMSLAIHLETHSYSVDQIIEGLRLVNQLTSTLSAHPSKKLAETLKKQILSEIEEKIFKFSKDFSNTEFDQLVGFEELIGLYKAWNILFESAGNREHINESELKDLKGIFKENLISRESLVEKGKQKIKLHITGGFIEFLKKTQPFLKKEAYKEIVERSFAEILQEEDAKNKINNDLKDSLKNFSIVDFEVFIANLNDLKIKSTDKSFEKVIFKVINEKIKDEEKIVADFLLSLNNKSFSELEKTIESLDSGFWNINRLKRRFNNRELEDLGFNKQLSLELKKISSKLNLVFVEYIITQGAEKRSKFVEEISQNLEQNKASLSRERDFIKRAEIIHNINRLEKYLAILKLAESMARLDSGVDNKNQLIKEINESVCQLTKHFVSDQKFIEKKIFEQVVDLSKKRLKEALNGNNVAGFLNALDNFRLLNNKNNLKVSDQVCNLIKDTESLSNAKLTMLKNIAVDPRVKSDKTLRKTIVESLKRIESRIDDFFEIPGGAMHFAKNATGHPKGLFEVINEHINSAPLKILRADLETLKFFEKNCSLEENKQFIKQEIAKLKSAINNKLKEIVSELSHIYEKKYFDIEGSDIESHDNITTKLHEVLKQLANESDESKKSILKEVAGENFKQTIEKIEEFKQDKGWKEITQLLVNNLLDKRLKERFKISLLLNEEPIRDRNNWSFERKIFDSTRGDLNRVHLDIKKQNKKYRFGAVKGKSFDEAQIELRREIEVLLSDEKSPELEEYVDQCINFFKYFNQAGLRGLYFPLRGSLSLFIKNKWREEIKTIFSGSAIDIQESLTLNPPNSFIVEADAYLGKIVIAKISYQVYLEDKKYYLYDFKFELNHEDIKEKFNNFNGNFSNKFQEWLVGYKLGNNIKFSKEFLALKFIQKIQDIIKSDIESNIKSMSCSEFDIVKLIHFIIRLENNIRKEQSIVLDNKIDLTDKERLLLQLHNLLEIILRDRISERDILKDEKKTYYFQNSQTTQEHFKNILIKTRQLVAECNLGFATEINEFLNNTETKTKEIFEAIDNDSDILKREEAKLKDIEGFEEWAKVLSKKTCFSEEAKLNWILSAFNKRVANPGQIKEVEYNRIDNLDAFLNYGNKSSNCKNLKNIVFYLHQKLFLDYLDELIITQSQTVNFTDLTQYLYYLKALVKIDPAETNKFLEKQISSANAIAQKFFKFLNKNQISGEEKEKIQQILQTTADSCEVLGVEINYLLVKESDIGLLKTLQDFIIKLSNQLNQDKASLSSNKEESREYEFLSNEVSRESEILVKLKKIFVLMASGKNINLEEKQALKNIFTELLTNRQIWPKQLSFATELRQYLETQQKLIDPYSSIADERVDNGVDVEMNKEILDDTEGSLKWSINRIFEKKLDIALTSAKILAQFKSWLKELEENSQLSANQKFGLLAKIFFDHCKSSSPVFKTFWENASEFKPYKEWINLFLDTGLRLRSHCKPNSGLIEDDDTLELSIRYLENTELSKIYLEKFYRVQLQSSLQSLLGINIPSIENAHNLKINSKWDKQACGLCSKILKVLIFLKDKENKGLTLSKNAATNLRKSISSHYAEIDKLYQSGNKKDPLNQNLLKLKSLGILERITPILNRGSSNISSIGFFAKICLGKSLLEGDKQKNQNQNNEHEEEKGENPPEGSMIEQKSEPASPITVRKPPR